LRTEENRTLTPHASVRLTLFAILKLAEFARKLTIFRAKPIEGSCYLSILSHNSIFKERPESQTPSSKNLSNRGTSLGSSKVLSLDDKTACRINHYTANALTAALLSTVERQPVQRRLLFPNPIPRATTISKNLCGFFSIPLLRPDHPRKRAVKIGISKPTATTF
jgi:hypothetical protein